MIAAESLRVFLAVSLVAASLCPGAWASAWATSEGSRSNAHATTTIDRRDFGMTYAGFAVGKQVVITIDAVGMNTAADASPE